MIRMKTTAIAMALAAVLAAAVPSAQAQIPTTDVANIAARAAQFVEQMTTMANQLENMKSQLQQAQQQYASMSGARGMGQELLGNQDYANIPTDWTQTLDMMNGGDGKYGNISAQAKKILTTMNGIDPSVFNEVDSAYGQLSGDQANAAASYQAVQGEQYNDTAKRFNDLKQLITKIDQAPDQKAILDLNARIGAQQVMLQNEQLKMQALAQIRESQKDMEAVKRQQAWIQDSHSHAPSLGDPVSTIGVQ